jgi:glycosyltransferase involved in cell wall biosynthesis
MANLKTSILMPLFNHTPHLEAALCSLEAQETGDLELIVVDGGSTDGSGEAIRNHAALRMDWTSRPGASPAGLLGEGFSRSRGEIMGWIHPDELLAPWALRAVESVFRSLPQVEWVTTLFPMQVNSAGLVAAAEQGEGFHAGAFFRGRNAALVPGFSTVPVPRGSTFWRRTLWERAGARIDGSLQTAFDFELWARFFTLASLHALAVPLGCARAGRIRESAVGPDAYWGECRAILRRYGRRLPSRFETAVRRSARLLPRRLYPLTGLAYPVTKIRQEGRGSEWIVDRGWII